jgi:thiamine-phosphate diphosphorylase
VRRRDRPLSDKRTTRLTAHATQLSAREHFAPSPSLMSPIICLVTDRRRLAGSERSLVTLISAAAHAGVHLVQVRERDLEARALVGLVKACVDAVRATRTRIVVNDRLDVALAGGAHGVHLRSDSMPAVRVRRWTLPGFLVGCSVHSREEAQQRADGADYLIAGTVFETPSKPRTATGGLALLRDIATSVPLPVLAIGGMNINRLREVACAGASGFAAIGLFADCGEDSTRVQTVVRQASLAFDTGGHPS